MSRSYYKIYSYTCGIKPQADYFRSRGRKIRHEHKTMLRYALDNCPLGEEDELLYHIPKRVEYDMMGAPHGYHSYETKSSLTYRIEKLFNKEYCCKGLVPKLRSYMIIRSRLKGYPLHSRRRYSYKECEDAFEQFTFESCPRNRG